MIVIGSRILPQHNKRAEQSVRSKIIKFGGERERERERKGGVWGTLESVERG